MSGLNPSLNFGGDGTVPLTSLGEFAGNDPAKPQYYKHGINISIEELGIIVTGTEALAQAILTGVIDWVLQYTGMDTQYERREDLDGNGNRRLILSHFPCQQILNVQIASRIDEWIDITRYTRLLEHGELVLIPSYFHWVFPQGDRNIRVRYLAGLTRIPPLMRMVIIELAQILLLKSGLLGATTFGQNPASQTSTLGNNTSSGSTTTDSTVKGIKEVAIETLKVTFADDKRTISDILQRPDVLKMSVGKMLDDILTKDNSILKRLDIMAKVMCSN